MKPHDPDLVSLLSGLAFVGAGLAFLLEEVDAWETDVTWAVPLTLLAMGLLGLFATLARRAGSPGSPTLGAGGGDRDEGGAGGRLASPETVPETSDAGEAPGWQPEL